MNDMTAKHTPGPWFVVETLRGSLSINKTDKVPIATVGGAGWHLGEETAKANACLIAAAPDLLLALRRLMSYEDDRPAPGSYGAEIYAEAEAAIAKAEGRA
jgi:hypothetical protein